MIAELEFGTRLLEPTLQEAPVGEVAIEQVDSADPAPLRTICWVGDRDPAAFESALAHDETVEDATRLVTTDHGAQYQVTYDGAYPGTDFYDVAVEHDGVFVSGTADGRRWDLRFRFADRDSFSSFRFTCEDLGIDLSVTAVQEQEAVPHAERYHLSQAQQEILLLASTRGFFEVPRDASLADLADELDISSQAASERLRRGLDSLVESALLTPSDQN